MRPASASHSSAPVRAASAAGRVISARSIWCAAKPKGSEGSRSIARCRSRYEPRSGASAIRTATSTRKTEQMARSAQAKNRCWAADSGPARSNIHSAAISPIRTGMRIRTAFSSIAEPRRPSRASIRIASSFSRHSERTRPARRSTRRACWRRAATASRSSRASAATAATGSAISTRIKGSGGDSAAAAAPIPPSAGASAGSGSSGISAAQRPHDRPRRSRSSRASSSRRTARCGGMCSRKAVISPISSNATATAREQGSRRSRGDRSAIRPSAASASSSRRRSSSSSHSAGPDAPPRRIGAGARSPSGVWSSAATCAWSLESRNRWAQSAVRAGVLHRPGQLAAYAALPAASPASTRTARTASRRARRDAGRRACPARRAAARARRRARRSGQGGLAVQPGDHHAEPFDVGAERLDRHGLVQRLEFQDGQHVLLGDPRIGQPLPGPRHDLAVPWRAER